MNRPIGKQAKARKSNKIVAPATDRSDRSDDRPASPAWQMVMPIEAPIRRGRRPSLSIRRTAIPAHINCHIVRQPVMIREMLPENWRFPSKILSE